MPKVTVDGVVYDSQTEAGFAQELIDKGIDFKFHPETVTLLTLAPAIMRNAIPSKSNSITYTPDFEFEYEGMSIVVETKGLARADNLLQFKMAHNYYTAQGKLYVVVGRFGTVRDGTRDYYLYSKKNILRRRLNTKNFFEDLYDWAVEREESNGKGN